MHRFGRPDLGPYGTPFSKTLSSAQIIQYPSHVQYPNDIKSPKLEFIIDIENGKYRYDLAFLIQFRNFCKDKPRMLPLNMIGLDIESRPSLPQTGRNRTSGRKPTTVDGPSQSIRVTHPVTSPIRTNTTTNSEVPQPRWRNHRKKKEQKDTTPSSWRKVTPSLNTSGTPVPVPVTPLQPTEGRWNREAFRFNPNSPEFIHRQILGMLNKLTGTNFDSISDQFLKLTNKSGLENPGTFIQIVHLIYKVATSQITPWSELYVRLCRKLIRETSNDLKDDDNALRGGHLFRNYLLDQCEEGFATIVQSTDCIKSGEEVTLYSDEYYAIQKVKRQGLGLVQFMGLLFKLQVIANHNMHKSIKDLIGNVSNPKEDNLERLCTLITNVGKLLDTPKARAQMDGHFAQMKEISNHEEVCLRIRFMLQDVLELREKDWIPRVRKVPVPLSPSNVTKKDNNKRERFQKKNVSNI